MIEVAGLEFRYREGEFHLQIPDLRVERNSKVAFIGPSGSGKTTLLHLIAGIATPAVGVVRTNGVDITSLGDAERRDFRIANIGLVFQEFELLEYLSVLENILLPYRINRSLGLNAGVRDRARSLAAQVGIDDKLNRFANQLSHGEKQRVAVCRALLPDPVVILADEPTGNLDPVNTERVLDILFDYAAEEETTLVIVTHEHGLLGRFERIVDFADYQP